MTSAFENAMNEQQACEHGNYHSCYFCEHARAAQLEAERDDYGRKYSALLQATQQREAELARQLEQAQTALKTIEDQASRAALVQDRSVGIIKQTCKIIADEAKAAQS